MATTPLAARNGERLRFTATVASCQTSAITLRDLCDAQTAEALLSRVNIPAGVWAGDLVPGDRIEFFGRVSDDGKSLAHLAHFRKRPTA